MVKGYVYLIRGRLNKSKKTAIYVGCTLNLQRRMEQHLNGKVKFTSRMHNLKLVYYFTMAAAYRYSVELHLKKNRRIYYSLLGIKKKSEKIEQGFKDWCEKRGIKIKHSGILE